MYIYIYVFVVYNIMHLKSSKYILYMRVKVSNIDSCHRKRWDGARRKTIEWAVFLWQKVEGQQRLWVKRKGKQEIRVGTTRLSKPHHDKERTVEWSCNAPSRLQPPGKRWGMPEKTTMAPDSSKRLDWAYCIGMCFADNLNSNVVGNKAKTSHVGTVSKWGGNRDREREREKLTRNSRRQGRKSMQGVHFRARAERPRTAMLLVSNRHV